MIARTTVATAITLAVTGFAASADGGVKRHYSHAYYGAADRCGAKDAVGRNVRREHSTLANGRHVSKARYRVLTARLDRLCRPVTAPQQQPQGAQSAAPPAASASSSGGSGGSTVQCESGGNYAANTGNGFYGGWQFDSQTWDAYGDSRYGEANEAPPAVQDQAAANVPYDAWPNC